MLRASDVRTHFSAVLDDAANGKVTHVIREGQVVAHIVPAGKKVVPANALVHDNNELLVMMRATLDSEADWLATDVGQSGFHQAGDSIGRVLGWIWDCDPEEAVHWFARYSIAVTDQFERRRWARPRSPLSGGSIDRIGCSPDQRRDLRLRTGHPRPPQRLLKPVQLRRDRRTGRLRRGTIRGPTPPSPDSDGEKAVERSDRR